MTTARGTGSEPVIVGIGETPLGRHRGASAADLQALAIRAAVDDAGLRPEQVDGLVSLGPYTDPSMMYAATIGEYAGLRPTYQCTIDSGGLTTPMAMVAGAIEAIRSGQCSVAVCVFGDPAQTGRKMSGRGMTTTGAEIEFEDRFGLVGTVIPYALLAQRHGHEFGTTAEDLGAIAIATRRHAARRSNSVRRDLITLDDYLASRMISSPLRLLDCSTVTDGAGALVIASGEIAGSCPHPPVVMRGTTLQASHRNVGQFTSFDDLRIRPMVQRCLQAADRTLADVDVALVHDAFTLSTALFLEEAGFCGRGEAGDYVRDGHIDLGAACPVNTHGGLLSQGHVAGILHLTEAVRQLRGDAGAGQVAGAELAMILGGGGIFGVSGCMLLQRA